ncbi:FecCD family ABC transporter permease [Myroides sp. LJL119]
MQKKLGLYIIVLTSILLVISVLCLFIGVYQFEYSPLQTWVKIIFPDPNMPISLNDRYILLQLRLPRVIMALLIGSGLAISGTVLQGLFKNPLASPDLIGVTAGSVLFAAVTIVLGSYIKPYIPELLHYSLLSIMSFVGAMITMVFVYRISTVKSKTNVGLLLLSGVAIAALSGAATGLLTYISTDEELRNLSFWTLGSLAGASWNKNIILALVVLPSAFILIRYGKALNAMMLGEKDAQHLGISVEKVKKRIILLSALIVGTSVAFAGSIGFVGLIVPYILRILFNSNYTVILPLGFICGAILLVVSDTISRSIIPPSEIPIGILTAILGAPVLISILIRTKKKF